jgi:hypothetical protein
MTPEDVGQVIRGYLAERQAALQDNGEKTKDGRRFFWCGDVLEFLSEGLSDRLASFGITLTKSFPGPFRLMDEEQGQDGQHTRRFWTTALAHGCPVARLCTLFYHRHDQVRLPRLPRVVAYPPEHAGPEAE